MLMSDETILALAARPETLETAFRGLVAAYQQRLYGLIRHQVRDHADADDILQNTLMKIFRHLHKFEGRSGLYTWMYRIARNEIANHRKRVKRHPVADPQGQVPDLPADAWMDADRVAAQLEALVQELPARQQRVFRLRYFDELTYKEIAELLDVTEGALKASFHHAVRKIEARLKANPWG